MKKGKGNSKKEKMVDQNVDRENHKGKKKKDKYNE
jgi:hypothetical protein